MATFTAKFRTLCDCGDMIEEGDEAVFVEGSVEHAHCPGDIESTRQMEFCSRCFMALPVVGTCDCDE